MDDCSLEPVRPTEEFRRQAEISIVESCADPAAAHPALMVFNNVNDIHLHTTGSGDGLEEAGVALTVLPKSEVGAHGDVTGLQRVEQDRSDEGFSTKRCQIFGEGNQDELFDPQRLKEREFFFG